LTYEQLTDLRIFTGARVLYALTAAKVAGALFQTLAYDYRRYSGPSHFGPPLSSVEIKLVGHQENAGASAREGKVCTFRSFKFSDMAPTHAQIYADRCPQILCSGQYLHPISMGGIGRSALAVILLGPLALIAHESHERHASMIPLWNEINV
jgi:hypothetical protein